MPTVIVKPNEYFESVLRKFKRICEKSGVHAAARKKEFYEKPTTARKRKKAAAVKRHLKRLSRERSILRKQPRFGYISAIAESAAHKVALAQEKTAANDNE